MNAPDGHKGPPVGGDEAELYRDLQPRLLGLLGSTLTARVQTLEDACSFAWVALIGTQPDRSSVFGWLYVSARREALRLIAAERRTPTLELVGDRHLLAFREPGASRNWRRTSSTRASTPGPRVPPTTV